MQSGMIVVYKEPGYTSSDVVAKLRGILHTKKIGHTGTLDPAAEGVLPVCIGYATRLCDMIAARDKEYEAVLRLGVTTDTQDMTGTVQTELPPQKCMDQLTRTAAEHGLSTEAYIVRTVQSFSGTIWQTPPRYSAIWINGTRAYDLARKGADFEIPRRQITIFSIEVTKIAFPLVSIRVVCSPGTYIRTLCDDIGKALGVGGAMEHLLRTRVGNFTLERALKIGEIEQLAHEEPEKLEEQYLYPTDYFFQDGPAVTVSEASMPFLQNGNPLSFNNLTAESDLNKATILGAGTNSAENAESGGNEGGEGDKKSQAGNKLPYVRVYGSDGDFYGVYQYNADRRRLVCVKMFHEVNGSRRKAAAQ